MPADLIVLNAKIYTMDPARPVAAGLAIRDRKFLAVGGAAELEGLRGPQTQVIDLNGRTVLPGLCDAHIHFSGYALAGQNNAGGAVAARARLEPGFMARPPLSHPPRPGRSDAAAPRFAAR
jgi:predicted amidohydrolase YtcJ